MTLNRLFLLLIALWLGSGIATIDEAMAQAAANLVCTASITNVAFAPVNVRDATPDRTTGTINYSCTGGGSNGKVGVCLTLGAGSGGAAAGNTPRNLRRADGAALNYTLRSASYAGPNWATLTTSVDLSGGGSGTATETIYAEITSTGTAVQGGSYSSIFSGADVSFFYGTGNTCSIAGASPSFTVTATVTPSCTISVAPLAFGNVGSLASNVDAASSITARCTNALPYSIALGPGNGAGVTTPSARKMTSGANTLTYGIYRNSGRTVADVWGDQVTNSYSGTGTGADQSIPVYGRIPPQQRPPSGNYADTVVVTITY